MHALALKHETSPHQVSAPLLPTSALISALDALKQCRDSCETAGDETVGSYGLMACIEMLNDCQARCERAGNMLLEFAEIELTFLRLQLSECAELCDRCAKLCARYHDFSNWDHCVENGRTCADVCRYVLLILPPAFSASR
ncbi:hypothetical protein [Oleiharenicola lentus]|uniref:hypothetical protein n=1 Tax=Oleiharenicola lentus TaxID=2508720 RepID=UPI003F670AAB